MHAPATKGRLEQIKCIGETQVNGKLTNIVTVKWEDISWS